MNQLLQVLDTNYGIVLTGTFCTRLLPIYTVMQRLSTITLLALLLISCESSKGKDDNSHLNGKTNHLSITEKVSFSPLQYSNKIYIFSVNGSVNVIDRHTGHPIKDFNLFRHFSENKSKNVYLCNQPLIKNGILFFVDNLNFLNAFCLKSEKLIWKKKPKGEGRLLCCPKINKDDQTIIMTVSNGLIYSLYQYSGYVKWFYDFEKELKLAPLIINDIAYVITSDDKVFALNLITGKFVWKLPEIILADCNLIFASSEKEKHSIHGLKIQMILNTKFPKQFVAELYLAIEDAYGRPVEILSPVSKDRTNTTMFRIYNQGNNIPKQRLINVYVVLKNNVILKKIKVGIYDKNNFEIDKRIFNLEYYDKEETENGSYSGFGK